MTQKRFSGVGLPSPTQKPATTPQKSVFSVFVIADRFEDDGLKYPVYHVGSGKFTGDIRKAKKYRCRADAGNAIALMREHGVKTPFVLQEYGVFLVAEEEKP